jgi:hypothetical protein
VQVVDWSRLHSSHKPEAMDGINVELHLVPTPSSLDSPLNVLMGLVGEERQGHHGVVKLLCHEEYCQILDETIIDE